MAKAFSERGIKEGIQVNSVLPGPVLTNQRMTYLEKYAPAHNLSVEEALQRFPDEAGITHYGQPEDIANLITFLVSPAGKWMTGSMVRMDGGEIKTI
jgi:3-oxoacyl-[acyl-carrier protein] reductase